jgi:hypothetical protein
MLPAHELGLSDGQLYRAGELAPPGEYERVDRPGKTIILTHPDYLPASLDGTVALYMPVVRAAELINQQS